MFLELGEAHAVINPLRPARAMLAHGGDAHGDTAHGDDAPRRAFAAARHRPTPRRELWPQLLTAACELRLAVLLALRMPVCGAWFVVGVWCIRRTKKVKKCSTS